MWVAETYAPILSSRAGTEPEIQVPLSHNPQIHNNHETSETIGPFDEHLGCGPSSALHQPLNQGDDPSGNWPIAALGEDRPTRLTWVLRERIKSIWENII